jgi:drug/metabolite transporter superfamily protein YnfA
MNYILWGAQGMLAALFAFSGIMKGTQSPATLLAKGQTGVEGLPVLLIRFIALCEICGAFGLILPRALDVAPFLTPVAAALLGVVMILASVIHMRRGERSTAIGNWFVLLVCLFVVYGTAFTQYAL